MSWVIKQQVLEGRWKRFRWEIDHFRMTFRKHEADMREVREDYERVTDIYVRHLERLNAKAAKIVALQKANAVNLEHYINTQMPAESLTVRE